MYVNCGIVTLTAMWRCCNGKLRTQRGSATACAINLYGLNPAGSEMRNAVAQILSIYYLHVSHCDEIGN